MSTAGYPSPSKIGRGFFRSPNRRPSLCEEPPRSGKKSSRPVSRVLYGLRLRANVATIPLGRGLRRTSCNQPGWSGRRPLHRLPDARHPYSVLLPVGFALPSPLPETRCALAAPFHPYRASPAVSFLWHFPWGRPRRPLAATVSPWSPDFPPFPREQRSPGRLERAISHAVAIASTSSHRANRIWTIAARSMMSVR